MSREEFKIWRDEQPNQRYSAVMWDCWQAACEYQRESDAKICEEEESKLWGLRETRDWSPYIEGMSDGAGECAKAIRTNKGEGGVK